MTSVQVDASRLFSESYGGRVVAGLLVIEEQPRLRRDPRSGVGAERLSARAFPSGWICPVSAIRAYEVQPRRLECGVAKLTWSVIAVGLRVDANLSGAQQGRSPRTSIRYRRRCWL